MQLPKPARNLCLMSRNTLFPRCVQDPATFCITLRSQIILTLSCIFAASSAVILFASFSWWCLACRAACKIACSSAFCLAYSSTCALISSLRKKKQRKTSWGRYNTVGAVSTIVQQPRSFFIYLFHFGDFPSHKLPFRFWSHHCNDNLSRPYRTSRNTVKQLSKVLRVSLFIVFYSCCCCIREQS